MDGAAAVFCEKGVSRPHGDSPTRHEPTYSHAYAAMRRGLDRLGMQEASDNPIDMGADLDDRQRQLVRICILGMVVLGVGSMIGAMSVLYLSTHFPLLLIALSPTGRHLILVAPIVHPAAFLAVGTLRRLTFYVLCFFLGRTLGSRALAWLETRSRGAARFVEWLDRIFQLS